MNDSSNSTPATSEREPGGRGYSDGRTWIEGDLTLARRIGRPVREFIHVETAGGVVLLIATISALVLANTGWGNDIADFWHRDLLLIEFGDFHLEESLLHWVNDGLMAIFFFVVGLEIKRELVDGELADPRRAAIPAIAALGGMIVPAGLYVLFNLGGDGVDGWGIPMATDIAFAVGVMALLGSRVPSPLKVFLLTLAIVDDIGAILVIAIFYSDGISFGWLGFGAALIALIVVMRLARIWYMPVYVVVGVVVWIAFLESGVHATIAGVILGLVTPAKPLRPTATTLEVEPESSWGTVRSMIFDARETLPVAERLQHSIHPWSAFLILPLFAFANAGIKLSSDSLSDAVTSPIALGVVVGLVIGKPLGILAAAWAAKRLNIGDLPDGVSWSHVLGAGALAGIGFTVSLFVAGLAFDEPAITDEAKIGILAASAIAAVVGAVLLSRSSTVERTDPTGSETVDTAGSTGSAPVA